MNQTPPDPGSERPLVLLIDDSIDVHRLLTARLRTEAMTLHCVTNGEEGLSVARTLKPAIILLDLDMPGMDGFEVLRHLKDDSDTVNIPVLVLSGLSASQDKVTAFDLGAIDYVTKPFDIIEFKVRVRAALRVHNLVQMLAKRAQIDGLSGLWNRVYFDQRLEEAASAVSRHSRALSVALVDIDHFKSINDTYGHPAGDAVIQELARIISHECRSSDVCCRYGGEEFAIIMQDTAPEQAVTLCERIRTVLRERHWPRHPDRMITASFGIVGSEAQSGCDLSPSEWLEAADKNLYAAKTKGRDRVEISSIGGKGVSLADAG